MSVNTFTEGTEKVMKYRDLVKEVTSEFDTKTALNGIKAWLESYKNSSGMKKAVIGISGGKDSTIVAKILVDVLGKENVVGLLMPNGEQKDLADAIRVVELLDIKHEVINIEEGYWAIIKSLGGLENVSAEAQINIAPRIRMTTLYTYGQTHGCRVAGTDNLSERTLGYFTKFGDGGYDFNILAEFTSLEVMRIGEELGLPLELVYKTPDDGLSGMSDEEKLGILYTDMHNYLRFKYDKITSATVIPKIKDMAKRAEHKLIMPPHPRFYSNYYNSTKCIGRCEYCTHNNVI